MGDKKIAMLHIKKQFQCKPILKQWFKNLSQIWIFQWDSSTMIFLNGEYAFKVLRELLTLVVSTKLPWVSLMTFHITHLKCSLKRNCSIPIVIEKWFSLSKWVGLHFNITPTNWRPIEPSVKNLRKMESYFNDLSSNHERDIDANWP